MAFDSDQFYSTSPLDAMRLAFSCITVMQNKPEHIAAAVAVVLLTLCDLAGIRVVQVLESASRMRRDAEHNDRDGHYAALHNYVNTQVLGGKQIF